MHALTVAIIVADFVTLAAAIPILILTAREWPGEGE